MPDPHRITDTQLRQSIAADVHEIIRKAELTVPEPCRRIDPNSPDGQAIIAALPP